LSLLDDARGSIRVWDNSNNYICAKPKSVKVRQPIGEYWTAECVIPFEEAERISGSGFDISIGTTVDIWLGRGDTLHQVFSGRVGPIRKRMEGHGEYNIEFEARNKGELLNFYYWSGFKEDTITNVIKDVVSGISDITTNHVQIASTSVRIKVEEPRPVYEVLKDICDQQDWIFFVDNDGDLWAFERGYHTSSEDLSDVEKYEIEYVEDPDRIINYQAVYGERNKTKGGDSEWTEDVDSSTAYWECTGQSGATTSVVAFSDALSPDNKVGAGSSVIRGRVSAANLEGPTLTLTFREGTATPIDLSLFGTLQFSILYRFLDTERDNEESLQLRIQFITSEGNYYEYVVEIPGVNIKRRVFHTATLYEHFYGWHQYRLNFNILKGSEVTVVGQPDFSSISQVKFTVTSPLPDNSSVVDLMIDNMQFINGLHFGESSDATSISQYGRRDGKIIYDRALRSDTACQNIADKIVSMYKDPIYTFESISTSGIFNLIPGYQLTISITDWRDTIGPSTVIISEIEHVLDGKDLRTNLRLSSKYIPSLEMLLAGLSRDVDKLEKENLKEDIPDTGLFRYGPPGLDAGDIDLSPVGHDNLIRNPYFLVPDRIYLPNAVVPAQWTPSTVPYGVSYISTTEGKIGGQCLYFTDGKTMNSWDFPVLPKEASEDPEFYRVALWSKSEQSTGASLDVNLVYFRGDGTTGTIHVWDPFEGDGNWNFRETIVQMNTAAVSAFLSLHVNPGYGFYIDDVWVSRISWVQDTITPASFPGTYSSNSLSYEQVLAHTIEVGTITVTDMYWINTITYEHRVTSPGTGYCRVRIWEGGNSRWNDVNIFTNTTPQAYTISPNYIGEWNDDLIITFELAVEASEYSAQIENIEIVSRYRSAMKNWA